MHVCDHVLCFLIAYGVLCADVRDYENMTPLHNACLGGHKDVVQYLVEKANCDIGECNTTPACSVIPLLYNVLCF